jgi:Asp/Glu/hydantoin racemase
MTRIALIHAVAVAVAPIEAAFQRHWPEAERMNLLDDTLSVDRARATELTPAMTTRIGALADYAVHHGADAVQFTCSAFGPAINAAAVRHGCPVLKPNAAMFDAAFARGDRIGMVATFEPSVASMRAEFEEAAVEAGRGSARIEILCVPDAMAALRVGDAARHNALVAEEAKRLAQCDAIMLAQFSTSVAADACRATVDVPILTSPDAAVLKLKRMLAGPVT